MEHLIQILRDEIIHSEEVLQDIKNKDNPEFSKGYWSGKSSAYSYVLSKVLEELKIELKPDQSLIAEAENLIPKGSFCQP